MTDVAMRRVQKGWKELPGLSEQLISRTSIADQCALIISTVEKMIGGEVNLWLAYSAFQLPGTHQIDFPFFPATIQINRVIESHQTYRTKRNEGANFDQQDCVAIPLIAQGVLIGVLQDNRPGDQPFTQEEVDLLEGIATYSAISIQVTRQVAIKNWRFEQLALVRSVSFQIANVLDLEELTRRVTRLILHTFQYYYVAIFTIEPGDSFLHFQASARAPGKSDSEDLPSGFMVRLGEGMVGLAAETGQELVAPDVAQETRFRYIDSLPETQSEIALPLKVENKVLGVLDVQSEHKDTFHDIDILVLKALADNIALAIEQTHLFQIVKKRADQIATASEISRAIISILDLDKLLLEVVNLLHKQFEFTFVHLYSVSQERRKIIFQAGAGARSEAMKAMAISYDLDDVPGIIPWVARNGKTILANDVTQDDRYRPSLLSPAETSSELSLPLIFGDKVLGVLDIQSNQPNIFDPNDLPVFEAFAANVAISLRNATLYRLENRRTQIAEGIRDVLGLISSNVGLDQVLDGILTELERNLSSDVTGIWLLQKETDEPDNLGIFHLSAVHGAEKETLEQIRELDPGKDEWLSKVLRGELPAIRSENDPLGPFGKAMGYSTDYSSIATPLHSKGKLLGLLALAHESNARYDHESQEITATFASYASVAIENTRMYSEAQDQAWISTVLLQITEATQSITSIDELTSAIVRLTPLLSGVHGCSIFLWDESVDGFILKTAYGSNLIESDQLKSNPILPGMFPAFDQLRTTNAPVVIREPGIDLPPFFPVAKDGKPSIHVLLPLATRSEILGAFLIEYEITTINRGNNPDREEERLAIIQGIVQQTAIAIENIRLVEARQEDAYVTAVLLQVAQAVVGSNDLSDTLDSIVNIMPILVGIDDCVIYLWDGLNDQFRPGYFHLSNQPEIEARLRLTLYGPEDFKLLNAIHQSNHSLVTPLREEIFSSNDWQTLPVPELAQDTKSILNQPGRLLMGFPLTVKDEFFGALLAADSSQLTNFRGKKFEIIAGIAQQASLAIQNNRLQKEMVGRERLEREIQLAREIQQTFLPARLPHLDGWDLDVRWRPARMVGGDFYDYFELPGDCFGLVIADVSDKGMPAALYMAVTRTLIRAVVPDNSSPAAVLEHVNDLLLKNSENGLFITAFYAVLNLGTGGLIYANAGHNLPLVLRSRSHLVEKLEKGGQALGAIGESIHLTDHKLVIGPDDFVVLYTDGVTETFSPTGEIYGDKRLWETLSSTPGTSAHLVLDAIDQNLVDFLQGDPPGDDTTLMVVHRLPG